jgi:glucan phosphoethanolaminetransferase (alkaline phosphatase superfamily)
MLQRFFRNSVFVLVLAWAIWSGVPYVFVTLQHAFFTPEISWLAFGLVTIAIALSTWVLLTFMHWNSRLARVVAAAFLALGFAADYGLQASNGFVPGLSGLNMAELPEFIRLAVQEFRNLPDLAQDYWVWIVAGVAATAVLMAAAWIHPRWGGVLPDWHGLALPLALGFTFFAQIQPHAVTRLQSYAPFFYPAMAAKVALLESPDADKPRIAPYFAPALPAKVKKIVFIVDESVRGDYLTINTASIDTTPFLSSIASRFFNFGTATPVANCSTATRLALRTGIRTKNLPDQSRSSLTLPTIWQYARQAGFKVVHIDGFARKNVLYSFMSRFELSNIDERVLPSQTVGLTEIDNEAARLLNAFLARPEPMFIFVDKVGVHFPHNGRHVPKDYAYEPANLEQFTIGKQPDNIAVIRHYLRSLRWRVDTFFEAIAPQLLRDDTVVIYTSDHGQNMFEGQTKVQHCNTRFDGDGSARVPLLVATGNASVKSSLSSHFEEWRDKASHEPLFPTLLDLMGYGPQDVERHYGSSLFDPRPEGERRYILLDLFTGRMQNAP